MNILIIEDDDKIRQELQLLLEEEGYHTSAITHFESTIKEVQDGDYQLILLDINLPIQNGYDICKEIKKTSNIPILFVTSRDSEEDELRSIISGGNDFIRKPYNKIILLEKIKRALVNNNPIHYRELKVGEVTLDLHLSILKYRQQEVDLTRNEFRILYYFFQNAHRVITKEELIEYLWNDKYYLDENILTVNINRLRKKAEEIGLDNFIKTVHGQGYQL